ncbi:MBL fold metallo-hydrolase [Defluviimonas sp. WL0024]|uniref:MBL fold metallo-hydrolase n=1 Tax=Albidovulum salinarum TaxID=2984153 RepID=A0ABT2X854_9RHOB|nr:MBL fold metallo-hydrolase [Defluviimonas sp. WL0024]MCU9850126.1 MBL fold metallo-hydrolase [Defluviimonas sp. WL0024]
MLFRQLFDKTSSTYTYLLASRVGAEALLIDPVYEQTERYLKLLEELDLRLVKVVDTHVHADHVSAMGKLRDATRCVTVMGEQSPADIVSLRVRDMDALTIEGITLTALHTPGHTSESYSFLMDDRVFTGDTLLIRGTGRTDFQNGDPYAQYHSLFERLLTLPEQTFVFPAHDYKGDTVSTIGEERRYNPRLQVKSVEEYAEIMNNLNLPNPAMMDVAVPENLRLGLRLEAQHRVPAIEVEELLATWPPEGVTLVDIREEGERARFGVIPGSIHAPYGQFDQYCGRSGPLAGLAKDGRIVLYCAVGERSTLAVEIAGELGLRNVAHIPGGFSAWSRAGGAVERV